MKQGKFAQMKKTFGHSFFWLALLALAALFACACSGDDKQAGGATEETQIAIEDKTVAGVSEKGPFTVGSAVHIYELEFETLGHTGRSIPGKIASDRGDFRFTHLNLECQFAFMEVSGYYRNENTGKQSTAPITLNALVDLSDKETANINLLTHLAFERTLFLVNEGKPVKDAKQQAEQEILKAFYIENELIGDFEGLSIFKKGEGNAALLAISSLMQADLAEGDFSERLANFAYDIEKDGVWNDSVTATAVADWASAVSLSTYYSAIRSNIKGWKISDIIPDFEKSMDKFWWENYGLGDCDKEREGVVKTNTNALSKLNGVYFICEDNLWRLASDIEKDTYKWKAGKDGDVKFGDVVKTNCYVYEDKVWRAGDASDCSLGLRGCTALRQDTVGQGSDKNWYKCVLRAWRTATDIEKDTATWGAGEFDGEIRPGQVNKDRYYIYEGAKKVWREASEIEIDVYQKDCLKDGKLFNGNENKSAMYVCDGEKFRIASAMEILGELGCTSYNRDSYHILTQVSYPHIDSIGSWDMTYKSDKISKNYSYYKCTENGWTLTREKLNQGIMVDKRDGQEYKTIGIGSQVWMAENLNYAVPGKDNYERRFLFDSGRKEDFFQCAGSTSYENIDTDCIGSGEWIKADSLSYCYNNDIDSCAKYGRLYPNPAFYDRQSSLSNVCPAGWHIPDLYETLTLFDVMGDTLQQIEGTIEDFVMLEMKGGARFEEFFGAEALNSRITSYWDIYGTVVFVSGDYFYFALSNREARVTGSSVFVERTSERPYIPVRCIKDEE